ncbi:MAG: lipocalin family protein [Bacteroidota bacterium]
MKKNTFRLNLFLIFFGLLILSCSDSIEPLDDTIGQNEEEVVNEENSADDANDGDNSDDGNGGDDTNNDSGDSNGNDGNDDSNSGDDTSNDDTSGDDSSNDGSTDATIVGNWRLVSATINDGQASTVFNGLPVSFPFTSTSQDENVDIIFQENPNVISGMGQYTNIIQFTIIGNDFSEETTFDSPLTDGNWEMGNNELTISGSSQANGTFEITELTSNTLILQTDFEQTVPVDDLELDATGVLVIELARN